MTEIASPTIDDLIVPGTDDDIIEHYRTLSKRATAMNFGLLEDDVIVLDTETTGLDFKSCELIEVAAARLRGHTIVDEFDMFVHPQSVIPPEIVQLTSITNEMVESAPDAQEVMEAFCAFAGDAPLIAHNATFDHHFLKKGAGHDVGSVWIDSLQLSRIALPCLTSHKLTDLSRAFGLTPSTHRAIDDVRALCGLWRVILCALSDLPVGLLGYLADLYPQVPWSYRPIFAQIAASFPDSAFSLRDARSQRCAQKLASAKQDARLKEENDPLSYPTADEIASMFTPQSIVGRMYASFEPRDEQVVMARSIADAFKGHKNAAIEAGTGVGKSISYLLPAALLAQRNDITVGIATKSNALADQLIRQELPALSKALDKPLNYVALKGYENYPCLRKIERIAAFGHRTIADDAREMPPDMPKPSEELLCALAAILSFATQSAEGDLNSLGIRWGKISRSDLSSSSSECQKRRCPYYPNRCFLHGARRRAAAADVVITNHSLLFRTINSPVEVLPPIRYWIVDEAHSAEQEARSQWALHVNSHDLLGALDKLGNLSTGVLGNLARIAGELSGASVMLAAISRAVAETSRTYEAAKAFFKELQHFVPHQRKHGGYEAETIWLSPSERGRESFGAVLESGRALSDRLDMLIKQLNSAADAMADDASGGYNDELTARRDELTAQIESFKEDKDALDLVLDGTDDHYVYSIGVNQRRGYESFELTAELFDVGTELAQQWYPEVDSVIYTSATIAVGDEFTHFNHEVGFDRLNKNDYINVRLDSSYDFDRNMNVIVTRDMPEPSSPRYLSELEKLLVNVHVAMGGSTLTLFTNRREMEEVYAVVEPQLAQRGQTLLCQQQGTNVRHLRERFIAESESSLFALRSFWEGFDAAGDTLRCVVIPKLPFQRPSEPIALERDRREKNAWSHYALPDAVLTLKQAAGRLIRTSTDHGCLVLADQRLLSKGYGKVFLRALPKRTYSVIPTSGIKDALCTWRRQSEEI